MPPTTRQGTLENLCEKRTILGCPVGLPDGDCVLACKQGTEENCVVQFTDEKCTM